VNGRKCAGTGAGTGTGSYNNLKYDVLLEIAYNRKIHVRNPYGFPSRDMVARRHNLKDVLLTYDKKKA